mgnify:CR=1 FL=1
MILVVDSDYLGGLVAGNEREGDGQRNLLVVHQALQVAHGLGRAALEDAPRRVPEVHGRLIAQLIQRQGGKGEKKRKKKDNHKLKYKRRREDKKMYLLQGLLDLALHCAVQALLGEEIDARLEERRKKEGKKMRTKEQERKKERKKERKGNATLARE